MAWSSAFARVHKAGVIPDNFAMRVLLTNSQNQKVEIV
jgi:hypothetical protein